MSFRSFQDSPFRAGIGWQSLGNLQDEINGLMARIWHAGVSTGPFDGQQWAPVLDLYEQDDHYTLFAEMPGVITEEVEVTYVGSTLTIRGEKRRPERIHELDRPMRGERRFGTFCRSIDLPAGADADRLSARCRDGVLEITIPKSESCKPKAVRIQIDEG